ncbi:Aste57867_18114 [Aphanomyces stellatus]|uniref:Aste57867_18114 protein n=1 Tax=Aphanomyces stellatus TaxID=120398 RepID=A0A485LCX7_9STRA|nr:hypothetical protein As57867_018052 [Aphanomyces stellatus]VFT94852.1 Aste57867_18114 [Aphanomyces stellatus]
MSARITKQLLKAAAATPVDVVPAKKTLKGQAKPKATVQEVKKPKKKKRTRHFLEEAQKERTNADKTQHNLRVIKRVTNTKTQAVMQKLLQTAFKK